MPRLIIKAWGVVADFTWGVVDGVIDGARNTTNTTDACLDLENKVLSLCQGGAIAYTSKGLIRNLIIDATPNLLL